jgi:hypothetical protein
MSSTPGKVNGEWEFASNGKSNHDHSHRRSGSWGGWWSLPFGMLGPIFASLLGIVVIIIGIFSLKLVNVLFQSALISLFISSVSANLHWFFIFSLFMGYCDFFIRRSYFFYMLLSPAGNAASFTFACWIIAWIIKVVGLFAGIAVLGQIAALMRANLLAIFAAILAIGYFSVALSHVFRRKE